MQTNRPELEQYTNQLLELYRHTPGTLGHVRREDRRLASELYRKGIPLRAIEEAFLLATARRCLRAPESAPLAPVRSLHYFVPVIEEVMATPLPDGHPDYLKRKLREIQATHDRALAIEARRSRPV